MTTGQRFLDLVADLRSRSLGPETQELLRLLRVSIKQDSATLSSLEHRERTARRELTRVVRELQNLERQLGEPA